MAYELFTIKLLFDEL